MPQSVSNGGTTPWRCQKLLILLPVSNNKAAITPAAGGGVLDQKGGGSKGKMATRALAKKSQTNSPLPVGEWWIIVFDGSPGCPPASQNSTLGLNGHGVAAT